MNETQIQIIFPVPGDWTHFFLTAVFPDADGFMQSHAYKQDDIPADQAPALQSVVAALVGLAEPWQASQVWACLVAVDYDDDLDPVPIVIECVVLTVEAVNVQGGRRIFTHYDYPEFFITDPAAVEFFLHFTTA